MDTSFPIPKLSLPKSLAYCEVHKLIRVRIGWQHLLAAKNHAAIPETKKLQMPN